MATGDIHTVPRGDRWANVFEGNGRLIVSAGTKETATAMGRELARQRGVRHLVHDTNDFTPGVSPRDLAVREVTG